MLVVSRKASEEILFPSIGITIKVVRVKGSVVQLGIEAPQYVRVIRREALKRGLLEPIAELANDNSDHQFRNQLNELVLKIQMATHANPKNLSTTEIALRQLLAELGDGSSTANLPCAHAGLVLVVEDVVNERQLFASVLKLRGFDVIEAADGAQALEVLSSIMHLPDAVLVDLEMPRVLGEQVLRSIRADLRLARLRVFAVSARCPIESLIPSGLSGFDAWISKPLDVDRLTQLLSNLSESRIRPRVAGSKAIGD